MCSYVLIVFTVYLVLQLDTTNPVLKGLSNIYNTSRTSFGDVVPVKTCGLVEKGLKWETMWVLSNKKHTFNSDKSECLHLHWLIWNVWLSKKCTTLKSLIPIGLKIKPLLHNIVHSIHGSAPSSCKKKPTLPELDGSMIGVAGQHPWVHYRGHQHKELPRWTPFQSSHEEEVV